jgi:hypothetical protein
VLAEELEIAGNWQGSAAAWERLGRSYDAALTRIVSSPDDAELRAALTILDDLGARATAAAARPPTSTSCSTAATVGCTLTVTSNEPGTPGRRLASAAGRALPQSVSNARTPEAASWNAVPESRLCAPNSQNAHKQNRTGNSGRVRR